MKVLFYRLVIKIYKDNDFKNAKLCLLGDSMQCIFEYDGADNRYLIYGEKLFNFNSLQWKKCNLRESFRSSIENKDFLNNVVLKNERIISNKNGVVPEYIICNTYPKNFREEIIQKPEIILKKNEDYLPFNIFQQLLETYKIEDIFVLACNKKLDSPIIVFENYIKAVLNIPIFVSCDNESIDDCTEENMKNKLTISTIHKVKGLERKLIIVFGFDTYFYKYGDNININININKNICPNVLYVACTRATEKLVIFHDQKMNYLPFLDTSKIEKYSNFSGKIALDKNKNDDKPMKIKKKSVTELLKSISFQNVIEIMKFIEVKQIENYDNTMINLNNNIKQKYLDFIITESVSNIYGIGIPYYFEYKINNEISDYDYIRKIYPKKIKNYKPEIDTLDNKKIYTLKDIIILSKYKMYVENKLSSILDQINEYSWIEEDKINLCYERFNKLDIKKGAIFNHKINNFFEKHNIELNGEIDCVSGNNVYEFKTVTKINNKHFIQLALYMYILKLKKKINFKETFLVGDNILYDEGKNGIIEKIFKNGKLKIKGLKSNISKDIVKENLTSNLRFESTENYNYFLFNVLTNELFSIKVNFEDLEKIFDIAVKDIDIIENDDTFIDNNLKLF